MCMYSAFGKYSDPLTFSTFCYIRLILKWIKSFFPSSIYTQYPIMTKQKQVFSNVCKFILKKNVHLKCHVYVGIFRPFTQYFGAPLAAITASSLLGCDPTSLAHLYLWSFSHSSLQILSSAVRLDGERCSKAIFRSLQRRLIRFMSESS